MFTDQDHQQKNPEGIQLESVDRVGLPQKISRNNIITYLPQTYFPQTRGFILVVFHPRKLNSTTSSSPHHNLPT